MIQNIHIQEVCQLYYTNSSKLKSTLPYGITANSHEWIIVAFHTLWHQIFYHKIIFPTRLVYEQKISRVLYALMLNMHTNIDGCASQAFYKIRRSSVIGLSPREDFIVLTKHTHLISVIIYGIQREYVYITLDFASHY